MAPLLPDAKHFHGMAGCSPQFFRSLDNVSFGQIPVGGVDEAASNANMLLSLGFTA